MNAEPKEPRPDQCREPEDRDQGGGQNEGSYYYDDAHGYEVYDPESEDAEEDEEEGTQPNGNPDQTGV